MSLYVTRGLNKALQRQIKRRADGGHLRQLYAGVFTDDTINPVDTVIRRELFSLCAILAPGAIISHRSALESKPTPSGDFFLTSGYRRIIDLGAVRLNVTPGPRPLPSDLSIPTANGEIHRSSEARAFLENLQRSRALADNRQGRTLTRPELEDRLDRLMSLSGETTLNQLRDQARVIAPQLGLEREFTIFDQTIGMLLGTRHKTPSGDRAAARVAGRPYDGARVDLFDQLLHACRTGVPTLPQQPRAGHDLQAFIESYFSNFIEGTEFELEEAREIVMTGRPMAYRPDDSHDVIGTYEAVLADFRTPEFPLIYDAFEERLKNWNRKVIQTRAAMTPGEFKTRSNRAGMTVFVAPDLVRGTLEKGFERIMAADQGAARAAMAMFVVAEVHPFNDGNGRTARLAMNLALSDQGLCRIIIPTVLREDYIQSLKALSNHGHGQSYLRLLGRSGEFSAWLDYQSLDHCFSQLHASNALSDPNEALLRLGGSSEDLGMKPPG